MILAVASEMSLPDVATVPCFWILSLSANSAGFSCEHFSSFNNIDRIEFLNSVSDIFFVVVYCSYSSAKSRLKLSLVLLSRAAFAAWTPNILNLAASIFCSKLGINFSNAYLLCFFGSLRLTLLGSYSLQEALELFQLLLCFSLQLTAHKERQRWWLLTCILQRIAPLWPPRGH